eukprot:CAMPEP_0201487588 /NCGR_PEP_ID=MMETSP0151_2-20130828/13885_1 /ASSEMBLY_ACC=CAM_ASM_000257 /TAXON_ID=200890 /ORGANISM="Paramoeba atlantica, Strain 621/1 / CCAP 1560/9" /LENGTH=354 /DNA_ID=CAMNT_0047872667 /DNA_START=84 /DNA_END=1148 /DNA_ORIENTATION=+
MGVIKGGQYATEGMWRESSTPRDKLLHVIHHKYTHATVTVLLVLDLCIVLTSIALEIEHLDSEIEDLEECVHLCYLGDEHGDGDHDTTHDTSHDTAHDTSHGASLDQHTGGSLSQVDGSRTTQGRPSEQHGRRPNPITTDHDTHDDHDDHDTHDNSTECHEEEPTEEYEECLRRTEEEDWGNDSLKNAERALAKVSITILSLFLFEHCILIIALRLDYFRSPILVFDFCIISVSLALEIVFQDQPEAGLLIVARAWRFIRIIHGFHESTSDEVVKHTMNELHHLRNDIIDVYQELDAGQLVGSSGPEALKDLVEKETHNETIYEILKIMGTHYQKDKEEHLHVAEAVRHRMQPE